MVPEGLLPSSQEPAACPYPVHTFLSYFLKINFNIVLPSTATSFTWSCLQGFLPKPCIYFSYPPYAPRKFITRINLVRSTNHTAPHYAVFHCLILFPPTLAQVSSATPILEHTQHIMFFNVSDRVLNPY